MPFLLASETTIQDAFWQGLWGGVFQLVALGIIAFWVNFVYQRFRELSTARQELIEEIDQFAIRMYKPRKVYQAMIDRTHDPLAGIADPVQRETQRTQTIQRSLGKLISAISRFRALQVKIVPLYGFHIDVFGHYLAIWRFLKEMRRRMEGRETLFSSAETSDSGDAFYKLMDVFRYRIMVEKICRHPPSLVQPPAEVLQQMRQRGDALYATYFGPAPTQ